MKSLETDSVVIDLYNNQGSKALLELVTYYAESIAQEIEAGAPRHTERDLQLLLEALHHYAGKAIADQKRTHYKTLEIISTLPMQYSYKEYDPARHECRKALTVQLPYAEYIAQGKKKIEVRSKDTKYRGELIICSSQAPEVEGMEAGVMLCAVELYATKPLAKLTAEEWEQTCIPEEQRAGLKGYGWLLREPVRLVEYPVKGQLGIWNLVRDDLEFIPYRVHQALKAEGKPKPPFQLKAVIIGGIVIVIIFASVGYAIWGVLSYFLF